MEGDSSPSWEITKTFWISIRSTNVRVLRIEAKANLPKAPNFFGKSLQLWYHKCWTLLFRQLAPVYFLLVLLVQAIPPTTKNLQFYALPYLLRLIPDIDDLTPSPSLHHKIPKKVTKNFVRRVKTIVIAFKIYIFQNRQNFQKWYLCCRFLAPWANLFCKSPLPKKLNVHQWIWNR